MSVLVVEVLLLVLYDEWRLRAVGGRQADRQAGRRAARRQAEKTDAKGRR